MSLVVTRTIAETRAALAELPRPLGLVPTMGALHEGHLALVGAASAACAAVAASLFVNPTQFAPHEDFASYPRDEQRDLELFERAGVDLVFAPPATEMYPEPATTELSVLGIGDRFEGSVRPLFFNGVALVVTKLLCIARPERAYFGQKDAQQLAVVRRLARDLNLGAEIVAVPTVREPDGLAMSSRNAYLSSAERAAAPRLYAALQAGVAAAATPGADANDAVTAATRYLLAASAPDAAPFDIDYVAAVDADDFNYTRVIGPRSLLIAAVRLGGTRLLDNVLLSPSAHPHRGATL